MAAVKLRLSGLLVSGFRKKAGTGDAMLMFGDTSPSTRRDGVLECIAVFWSLGDAFSRSAILRAGLLEDIWASCRVSQLTRNDVMS